MTYLCKCIGRALVIGLAATLWTAPLAAQVEIPAGLTDLSSTSERVISYRLQEHMWQTPDGASHAMINRGRGAALPTQSLYVTR